MNHYKKLGFTLIELIVVIVILAILGTITFLAFQGYTKDARDSVRSTDIASVERMMQLYIAEKGNYPEPSNGTDVTYNGGVVWTQGTLGDSVITNLGTLSKKPIDPLIGNEYTYSVTADRQEYQIAGISEGSELTQSITAQTYAAKNANAIVEGDYNGKIAVMSSGSLHHVLAIPSIISTDLSNADVVDIITNKKLVFKGYQNLPASYSGASDRFTINGGFDFTPNTLIVFSGSLQDIRNRLSDISIFSENLKGAYDNTLLHDDSIDILFSAKLLGNVLGVTVNEDYSCKSIKLFGGSKGNGMYTIKPFGNSEYNVYCDMTTDGGGWTLVFTHKGAATVNVHTTPLNNYSSTIDRELISSTVEGTTRSPQYRLLKKWPNYKSIYWERWLPNSLVGRNYIQLGFKKTPIFNYTDTTTNINYLSSTRTSTQGWNFVTQYYPHETFGLISPYITTPNNTRIRYQGCHGCSSAYMYTPLGAWNGFFPDITYGFWRISNGSDFDQRWTEYDNLSDGDAMPGYGLYIR